MPRKRAVLALFLVVSGASCGGRGQSGPRGGSGGAATGGAAGTDGGAAAGGTGGGATGGATATAGSAGSLAVDAGASGGAAGGGPPRFVLLAPIPPSTPAPPQLKHTVAVTGASGDGATLVGVSTDYGGASDEIATRFLWTEAAGMVSLAPRVAADVGFGDQPKISVDGQAVFGALVKRMATAPGTVVTRPNAFYRWTRDAGYAPFGPMPELIAGDVRDVSDDGTVALGMASNSLASDAYAGFRWTLAGGYQPLADLPGWPPTGNDVAMSRDGRVILGVDGDLSKPPFVWSDAGTVAIPPLAGHTACVPHLLSGDGTVVFGRCAVPAGQTGGLFQTFRWTNSAPMALAAVGQGGDDVIATTGDGTVAMGNGSGWLTRWTASEGVVHLQPPEAVLSVRDYSFGMNAASLSSDGNAVYGGILPRSGVEGSGDPGTESFRWNTADGFVRLRPLPGDDVSIVSSASPDGTLHVGLSRLGRRGKNHAVLWDSQGARDIAAELTAAGVDLDDIELSMGSMVWTGQMIKVVGHGAIAGQARAWIVWLPARP